MSYFENFKLQMPYTLDGRLYQTDEFPGQGSSSITYPARSPDYLEQDPHQTSIRDPVDVMIDQLRDRQNVRRLQRSYVDNQRVRVGLDRFHPFAKSVQKRRTRLEELRQEIKKLEWEDRVETSLTRTLFTQLKTDGFDPLTLLIQSSRDSLSPFPLEHPGEGTADDPIDLERTPRRSRWFSKRRQLSGGE